jgi:hypothetical protein
VFCVRQENRKKRERGGGRGGHARIAAEGGGGVTGDSAVIRRSRAWLGYAPGSLALLARGLHPVCLFLCGGENQAGIPPKFGETTQASDFLNVQANILACCNAACEFRSNGVLPHNGFAFFYSEHLF